MGTSRDAEMGENLIHTPEKHSSGAKARVHFAALTARLKSCPVTLPSFSSAAEALTHFSGRQPALFRPAGCVKGGCL
jgi:hypothetical protein